MLDVQDLTITFGEAKVVSGVSFSLKAGETLGIVGESGSGKSMTALSLLRLIPEPGRISTGKILLEGQDLLSLPEKAMRSVRGGRIAMIFQDPMTCLNPVFSVGEQIAEVVRLHRGKNRAEAQAAAVEALRQVKIPDPVRRARQYPHELSGGMRQRVMIAMALAAEPDILLADEPTTALDVTVQAQILALIRELQQERGMAVLMITHDLGVVAETCDRVLVLYGGQLMEQANATELFARPAHPYTKGLLSSLPENAVEGRLVAIPGQPPLRPGRLPGCPFAPRCPYRLDVCDTPLPLVTLSDSHIARCHRVSSEGALIDA
ncbi:MAG: ABC transporter ATP-binding protein [Armatimonas sp.]